MTRTRTGRCAGSSSRERDLASSRACTNVRQVKCSRSYACRATRAPCRAGIVETTREDAVCVTVTFGTTRIFTSGLEAVPTVARYTPGVDARKRTVKLPSGRARTLRGASVAPTRDNVTVVVPGGASPATTTGRPREHEREDVDDPLHELVDQAVVGKVTRLLERIREATSSRQIARVECVSVRGDGVVRRITVAPSHRRADEDRYVGRLVEFARHRDFARRRLSGLGDGSNCEGEHRDRHDQTSLHRVTR